jgi:hypothetical protein
MTDLLSNELQELYAMPAASDLNATEPVVVSANAGVIDGIQATSRYVVVIVGFIIAALGLLKVHDIAGLISLIQSNGGQVLSAVSGLIALATAAYGVFKTHKRGAQIATVAADPRVPNKVATTK